MNDLNWIKSRDTNYHHTASTIYEACGFKVWKGRCRIIGGLYSCNEWHLERISDHKIIHNGKTAKECKLVLEYVVYKNENINEIESSGLRCGVTAEDIRRYEAWL